MRTSAQRIRAWDGPAILGYGYRPFFLFATIWAALAMALWVAMISGGEPLPITLDPVSWHAHALIFGYTWAVIAGFLMTAVPNWTGRFPLAGWPLALLLGLWLLARVAMSVSALLPGWVVVASDLAFPLVLTGAIAREILAGKNWRNLKVLSILGVMFAANAGFHWQASQGHYAAGSLSTRAALAAVIALIVLIGGRIVPSFTRNWLAARKSTALPAPIGRGDHAVAGVCVTTLTVWTLWPDAALSGWLCLVAAFASLWRLARWQGLRCLGEPLVWVLHVAYLFIPLGFAAVGLAALGIGAETAAKHLWMVGAVGLMTLAVMTRASLGHSGLPLAAGAGVSAIYLALIISVLARFAAGWWPGLGWLTHLAATGWIAAMAGFAVLYWPILTRPKVAPKKANRTG